MLWSASFLLFFINIINIENFVEKQKSLCYNNYATQSHILAPAGNNLCKKVFPLFLIPCGTRLCSNYARMRKRRKALFLRSFAGAVFISCGDYIVTLIPTLFVAEYIF